MTQIVLTTILVLTAINGLLAVILVIAEHFFANYGECKITINKSKELTINGGASLLSSLNSQKIFLPSACGGRGTCAYCKCKITNGAGPLLPTEDPLLSMEEKNNQIRLACQVKVKQDLQIEIPEELFNIKEFSAEVAVLKDLTHDIKLLRLNLIEPNEIYFKSGQYVQLQTEPYNGVKERVSRAYSMASSNQDKNHVELMVRLVPDGICTTWVHQYLQAGDKVKIIGPMGDFYLRDGESEIVFVAGGSGMAPIVSLLHHMVHEKIQRKATYFFGAVKHRDLFFETEMKAFEKEVSDFRYVPALSEPDPEDNWKGETGLITLPLENYLKTIDTNNVQAYLCGSPGMINACVRIFKNNGVEGNNIFFDPFA